MTTDAQIEKALSSSDPVNKLRSLAQSLLDNGEEANKILAQFEEARRQLRIQGRENEEDALMDVMDFLTGWCSPHMKLPGAK